MDCKFQDVEKRVICLIPHYDDELFLLPLLSRLNDTPTPVVLVYLTTASDGNEQVFLKRQRESTQFVHSLSMNVQTHHMGKDLGIDDLKLPQELNRVHADLKDRLLMSAEYILVSPAWEGSHPDHDAAFLLGYALSKQTGCQHYCYLTYNGYQTHGKWFKVFQSLPSQTIACSIDVNWQVALRFFLQAFKAFPSQWQSWIALAPVGLLTLLMRRRWFLYHQELQKITKPHPGLLSYERYHRMSWDAFISNVKSYWDQHGHAAKAADELDLEGCCKYRS